MTTLTVIMPTYNGAQFLRPQLDTILQQSAADFELLVVDDGSTDGTVSIVDEYAISDPRVRRLPAVGNVGQLMRLRQLMQAVSSEFVTFADQDDLWDVDRNARLLEAIGDRAVAYGRSQLIDRDGHHIGQSLLEALDIDPFRTGPLSVLFHPLVSAHSAIVRRSWMNLGAFSQTLPFDHVIGLEAMLSLGLVYVDDVAVLHRMHGGNQMNGSAVKVGNPRRLSRQRFRESTGFVQSDRLNFFQMLGVLSMSEALSPETRKNFINARNCCRYAWYQPLDFKLGKNSRLAMALNESLSSFATSEGDLRFFQQKVRSLTHSQFSPTNIAEGLKRYIAHS